MKHPHHDARTQTPTKTFLVIMKNGTIYKNTALQ